MLAKHLILIGGAIGGLTGGEASAQKAAGDEGEIVVTARRHAESLQDVPVAVTVLDAQLIREAGVERVSDFVKFAPNVNFETALNLGQNFLTIRGISQSQLAPPPAAIVVDGVLTLSPIQFNVEEFDVEQIEILKGPQGAMYGRNAIAGAINITTARPGDELKVRALAGYGSGDEYRARAAISGPLARDVLGVVVGASYTNRGGQIRNVTTGRFTDHYEDLTLQARGIFTPAAGVSLDLRYRYSDTKGADASYVLNPSGNPDVTDLPVESNVVGSNPRQLHDVSGKLDVELGFATLSAIVAHVHVREDIVTDYDFTAADLFSVRQHQQEDALSQELRLSSTGDGALHWLVGAYHVRHTRRLGQVGLVDPGLFADPPAPTGVADFEFLSSADVNRLENYSGFGQIEYDIAAQWEIGAALRYDSDRLTQTSLTGVRRAAFDKWQPKLTLTYKPTADLSAYGSYGVGFRSGDFNPSGASIGEPVARAESATTYELGLKTRLLDRRLTVNAAAYWTELKDGQIKLLDFATGSNVAVNIDQVRVRGFEIEAAGRPASWLEIHAAYGYTDASVRRFAAAPALVGNRPPRVPTYSLNAGFSASVPVGNGWSAFLRPDYRRLGSMTWDVENVYVRRPVNYLDARAGMRSDDDRWMLTAFVRNAFDDRATQDYQPFSQSGHPLGLDAFYPSAGRSFGIDLTFRN